MFVSEEKVCIAGWHCIAAIGPENQDFYGFWKNSRRPGTGACHVTEPLHDKSYFAFAFRATAEAAAAGY